jgi:hypothetical protein
MTHIEDLVRSTTRALAGTVGTVRPLPALPEEPSLDEVSRRRGWRRAALPAPLAPPAAAAPLAAATRLRAAQNAAADGTAVREAPGRQHVKRARGWLIPLAAAASVLAIVAAAVLAAHLASPTARQGTAAATAQPQRPEFYMTATYPAAGPNVLHIQVRRTAGGVVTGSASIPAANMGWGNNITAAANDRAFFIGRYPCSSTTAAVTTFYRIAITGSGRIIGIAAAGRPVQGMLSYLAVSPDGSQMAYTAVPGNCGSGKSGEPAAGTVNILDLSTGAIRTWQNTARRDTASGLSWAPDGRTLIIDEYAHAPGGRDLTVFGLNTASSGGSLQAHSTILLQRSGDCDGSSTCVPSVIAGPGDSLTALEFQKAGQQKRVQIVSIPLAAGKPQTILYSELSDRPEAISAIGTGLYADPSGRWVLLWPSGVFSQVNAAGWISGGRLHRLPGVAKVFPQGIAW